MPNRTGAAATKNPATRLTSENRSSDDILSRNSQRWFGVEAEGAICALVLDDVRFFGFPREIHLVIESAESWWKHAFSHCSWVARQVDDTIFGLAVDVIGIVFVTLPEKDFIVSGAIRKPHPLETKISERSREFKY